LFTTTYQKTKEKLPDLINKSPNSSNSKIVDPFEIPSMLRNTKFSEVDPAI
jgi:hypothetical protein